MESTKQMRTFAVIMSWQSMRETIPVERTLFRRVLPIKESHEDVNM